MFQQRACIFCGDRADSREHVIAEWLTKRMKVREHGLQPARFIKGQGLRTFPKIKPEHFRTRQVCQGCNGGWMRELEQWFEKRLGFLVEPEWPRLADEMLKALRGEADSLIRWMIKTAIIFECATPKGFTQSIPDSARKIARDGVLSSDLHLCLAYIANPGLNAHVVKGYPVWNGGVLHEYQQHALGFSFAVHLNHLAIRLIRCPEAKPGIKASLTTSNGQLVVPFWVKPLRNYSRPVVHSFPDFASFIDGIEIYANSPDGLSS